jgi:hypothetical protein
MPRLGLALSANEKNVRQTMNKWGLDLAEVTVCRCQAEGDMEGVLETEYAEGMQIDRGYISLYIVTAPDRIKAALAKLGDDRHCPGSARADSGWQA